MTNPQVHYMSPLERAKERAELESMMQTYVARGGQIVRVKRGISAAYVQEQYAAKRDWGFRGEYYGR